MLCTTIFDKFLFFQYIKQCKLIEHDIVSNRITNINILMCFYVSTST